MLTRIRRYGLSCLNGILAPWKLRIDRTVPLDLRKNEGSPRYLILNHETKLGQSLIIDVPVSRLRSGVGEALSSAHPFVRATKMGKIKYSGSSLELFYRSCQPGSSLEVLDLCEVMAPGFAGLPAPAYVMPWNATDPETLMQKRGEWMKTEARREGLDLGIEHGFNAFGPVSDMKGSMELRRLQHLRASMEQHGFLRCNDTDGDIGGRLLTTAAGVWCLQVQSGHHRSAVAAALGMDTVPVRIGSRVVKREEVGYWPQVVAGRVTVEGALKVFDRVMEGRPPRSCSLVQDCS